MDSMPFGSFGSPSFDVTETVTGVSSSNVAASLFATGLSFVGVTSIVTVAWSQAAGINLKAFHPAVLPISITLLQNHLSKKKY